MAKLNPMMARILIVDDSEITRRCIREMLENSNLEVVAEAADGTVASALFNKHRPNLVVLDYIIPGLSFEEVLTEIRRIDPGVRILITTAFTRKMITERALKAGVHGSLLKPFDRKNLLKGIEDALR